MGRAPQEWRRRHRPDRSGGRLAGGLRISGNLGAGDAQSRGPAAVGGPAAQLAAAVPGEILAMLAEKPEKPHPRDFSCVYI